MTRLIIWRHGNTDWNAASRVQGQTDAPLNDLGREQARTAAPLLAALRPDAIVASDLSRAADTAAALAALTGLPVRSDARLRERHFGRWQGLLLTEIAERFPDEYARWRAGDPDPGAGIEPLDELGKRIGTALQEVAAEAAGGTIVVATHGGAARQGVRLPARLGARRTAHHRLAAQLPLDRAAPRRRTRMAPARPQRGPDARRDRRRRCRLGYGRTDLITAAARCDRLPCRACPSRS